MQNAFLLADGFGRKLSLRARTVWGPPSDHRIWKSNAPGYSSNGAPVASRRSSETSGAEFRGIVGNGGFALSDPPV